MQFILSNTYLAQKRTKGFILQHIWLAGVCLGFPTKCLTFFMSAIFIYYTTDCTFFLHVLSNEKAKILSKATDTNSHCPHQGSPPTLQDLPLISWEWSDETNPRRKLSHLHHSWYQILGDTMMYVWQRYLFFWKCNKDPPKASGFHKCGISAAELISL